MFFDALLFVKSLNPFLFEVILNIFLIRPLFFPKRVGNFISQSRKFDMLDNYHLLFKSIEQGRALLYLKYLIWKVI
jgi:hypothetical protein